MASPKCPAAARLSYTPSLASAGQSVFLGPASMVGSLLTLRLARMTLLASAIASHLQCSLNWPAMEGQHTRTVLSPQMLQALADDCFWHWNKHLLLYSVAQSVVS